MNTVTFKSEMPIYHGRFEYDLPEMMYYLYLPVCMPDADGIRLPPNVECCRELIEECIDQAPYYKYVYLSARKGWASPDNPLNRPGWHADGYGSNDLNFVWCVGPATRFAVADFANVSRNHLESLKQFADLIEGGSSLVEIYHMEERSLYEITPTMVHATPLIKPPGCMRQYVKVSMSDHPYNLEDNSHNHLFDYNWTMHPRSILRNDPAGAGLDYYPEK